MTRFKFGYLLLAILACGAMIPAHADTAFSDSTFNLVSNYSITTFTSNGATTGITQCATCGNPNGAGNTAAQIILTFPDGNSAADLALVNNTFSYNPTTQGAITSISASVDKDLTLTAQSGGGNTFHPLIEQDGVFYIASIPGTGLSAPGTTGYLTLSQTGLTAANFVSIDLTTGVTGTANPNFDGDTMLFGLAQVSGSTGSSVLTADYDNLNLNLVTAAVATPEPSSSLLLGIGLAGLIFVSRRKLVFNN